MKKLSVVLYVTAALVFLLGGPSGTSGALAGPLPNQPASANTTVAAAGGTGILSIPAAAFTPFEDGYDFQNDGRFLRHYHGPSGSPTRGWYLASVELPQGATVTKMTFYYKVENVTAWTGTARLQRTKFEQGNYEEMATIVTTGTGTQYTSDSTSSIQQGLIDNSQYAYWVVWDLPWISGANDVWGCGMTIEYTPPATLTGILSIPAAGFTPFEDGYNYENDGRYLFTTTGVSGAWGWYLAPVQLPQGATVTKMTFHWYDTNAFFKGMARLQRTKFGQGNYEELAYAETAGSPGYGSTSDDTISYATIDNSQYAYWVIWDIPVGSDFKGCGTVIEYTLPTTGTGTGIISISAAPFKPFEDGYDYEDHGRYLKYFHSPGGLLALGSFYAQAQLPQGATVTKVTYYYYDTFAGGNGGGINLQRTHLGLGNYENMAGIGIGNFAQNYSSYSDETIDYATVDNSQYAYWVVLGNLPVSQGGDDWLCGVVIEYSYRLHLPMVLRNY